MTIASTPDLQPTLTGETVILRPIRPADWDEMFAAASDPLIWKGHPISDRYTDRLFRLFLMKVSIPVQASQSLRRLPER